MKISPELKRLNAAVAAGNHAEVRAIVAKNPELARDPRPLSQAALHGQPLVVKALLDLGSDANAAVPSHDNYRPLHRAIEHKGVPFRPGHLECVQTLLAAGANPALRSTWRGLTALGLAGATGEPKMIDYVRMHTHAAQLDIFTSALLADEEKVKEILSKGMGTGTTPTTASDIARSRDTNGMTPLHCAAHSGLRNMAAQQRLARITHALLDAGANPDSCEDIGPYHKLSVLHFAGRDNLSVAETLLKRGANPNLGFGAALWHPPYPLAVLFMEYDADVNMREEENGPPLLHSRIHWNLPDVALWLLENGANPNLTDAQGNTALHEAALRGINPKVVEALLKSGADVSAQNNTGQTARDIAKEKGRDKILSLLKKKSL